MSEFGFTKQQGELILTILKSQKTIRKACIFGSRATGSFTATFDVDIALWQDSSYNIISQIKANFEESLLPYFVDIVDYQMINNKKLKDEIDRDGKILYVRN